MSKARCLFCSPRESEHWEQPNLQATGDDFEQGKCSARPELPVLGRQQQEQHQTGQDTQTGAKIRDRVRELRRLQSFKRPLVGTKSLGCERICRRF